jgi:hypothetical protein
MVSLEGPRTNAELKLAYSRFDGRFAAVDAVAFSALIGP